MKSRADRLKAALMVNSYQLGMRVLRRRAIDALRAFQPLMGRRRWALPLAGRHYFMIFLAYSIYLSHTIYSFSGWELARIPILLGIVALAIRRLNFFLNQVL